MIQRYFLSFTLLIFSYLLSAQQALTVEDIYSSDTFSEKSVNGINWMNDGRYYTALESNKVVKYDITTGKVIETLVDGAALGLTIDAYDFSADEKMILLMADKQGIYRRSYTAVYHVYDPATKSASLLSTGRQAYATFSPDNSQVSFTRDNNLFMKDLDTGVEMAITTDGEFNKIINGSADWVYEEEFTLTKMFAWSPDGSMIAFLRSDESNVREYNLQLWKNGQLYPEDYRYKYPKAGEDNSVVEVWVHNFENGKKKKMDTGTETDMYLPRIQWTTFPSTLSIIKLNRLQNELQIIHADPSTGGTQVIYTEKSNTYVDLDFCDDLLYLSDGKHFLMSSEKDGYKHFYRYTVGGTLVNQITSGDFEAVSLEGLNEKKKLLYYLSTEDSPLERHLYVIGLNGKGKKKLSGAQGTYSVNMSPDTKYQIRNFSSATMPRQVSLVETAKNLEVKKLETNDALQKAAKEFNLQPKTFMTFKAKDGPDNNREDLNAFMLKPADFDASKKYPVLVFQYSGPGSQRVANSWAGDRYYWHQLLVQKGYIVVYVDVRGTGARGVEFKKLTYGQLGKYETEDLIETGKQLAALPYVDASRLGVWGWSYGGYMSSLAIFKGNDVFKTAIAVAPVSNWRYYDTVYTERYMGLPQDNGDGYDDNSPVSHTAKLNGNYLLIHGTGDDNVHFQNAVALQNRLILSGKKFESFYYPDLAHSLKGPGSHVHVYTMMADFILNNL
jgi:dipeptidyl-peptidase-4